MFITQTDQGYILRVRLTPNSSSCRINGCTTGPLGETYLKISITAIAQKGKANQMLTGFIADLFRIPQSSVTLLAGKKDHWKKILIAESPGIEEIICQLKEDLI